MNLVFRVRIGFALAVPLLAASPSVIAWGPNAFYPTPVDTVMPGPERAQQLRGEVSGVLETLRYAHWHSARLGWTGGPVREGDNPGGSGASAYGQSSPDR
jgi:hypothetical protein